MTEFKQSGKFFAIEGIDGIGKSTLIENLKKHFETKGERYLFVRQPGTTNVGEAVRQAILDQDPNNIPNSDDVNVLLLTTAMRDAWEKVIAPALSDGINVVTDRWVNSTLAYNFGDLSIMSSNKVAMIEAVQYSLGNCTLPPHAIVLIPSNIDFTLKRIEGSDHFEKRGVEFFRQVHNNYLPRFQREALSHIYSNNNPVVYPVMVKETDTPEDVMVKVLDFIEKEQS